MENQENKKTVSFKETPEIINESIIRNTPIIDNHTEINKKRRKENKETKRGRFFLSYWLNNESVLLFYILC